MLIGLGGELESGKSSIAGILVKKYGYHEFSFAAPMKETCMQTFGLSWEQCFTTDGKATPFNEPIHLTTDHVLILCQRLLKRYGIDPSVNKVLKMCEHRGKVFNKPREVLQFVGTEIMRDCLWDNIHVDLALMEIERAGIPIHQVVISDARFNNERHFIRTKKGSNILIDCPQAQIKKDGHRSENSLGERHEYDYIIFNDKTKGMSMLEKSVDNMMKYLGVPSVEEVKYL